MNASRKADREKIAAQFLAVAAKFGATVERSDEPAHVGWSGAGIHIAFALNGVGAMIDIDNLHGGEDGLLHWYNDYGHNRGTARHYSPGFNVSVGQSLSAWPHHKATSHGSWDMLAARLQAGLRHAANETAFID